MMIYLKIYHVLHYKAVDALFMIAFSLVHLVCLYLLSTAHRSFNSNRLTGTLPSELGALSNLWHTCVEGERGLNKACLWMVGVL